MDPAQLSPNTPPSRVPQDDLQHRLSCQISDDDGGDPGAGDDDFDYDIPSPEAFSISHTQDLSATGSTVQGILSRLPFVNASADGASSMETDDDAGVANTKVSSALGQSLQQIKTRRRRGSLRKIALLGRGAQQERRDAKDDLVIDTSPSSELASALAAASSTNRDHSSGSASVRVQHDALGLEVPDVAAQASVDSYTNRNGLATSLNASNGSAVQDSERLPTYNSTTDEDEVLHMPKPGLSASSGSDSYFAGALPPQRRSIQQAKSPLSFSGLSATGTPAPSDWDYTETEWWGWVVLGVTWFVFVIGMGSCLDVWSWAWDVGKTPYAPPELEDDETLPIVGYYPALIILTGVMAWVWVVVAWVGMKYFRHAKISGD